ncbi:MAG: AbrB/MazE/SpoVT family DNA-binding domain-containing protein [Longimicrobiales bacterium]|nr:AbrB/MazE/SpoVT family DNA-binding domain-containing protein [Longimicrobiales bacterium]
MPVSLISRHPSGGAMSVKESSRIGKRGTLVIPARLRRKFGIEEGSEVITEEYEEAVTEVRAFGLDPDEIPHHRPTDD